MDKKTKKFLERLIEELKKQLGDNLRSLILYGSLARGDFMPGKSDVNLMVILQKVEMSSLFKVGKIFRKYRAQRFALPLVVDSDYLKSSLDVFPLELAEIKRYHQVLFGEDLISQLNFQESYLRLQLEREFKQNLLWLRELLVQHPDFHSGFYLGLLNASRSLSAHLRALSLLMPESPETGLFSKIEKLTGRKFPALQWLLELRTRKKVPKKAELSQQIPQLLEEADQLTKWLAQLSS